MRQALIVNSGHALAPRVQGALVAQGFAVIADTGDLAMGDPAARLNAASGQHAQPFAALVYLPPPPDVSPGQAADTLFALLCALKAQAGARARDSQGEWSAPAQAIVIVEVNPTDPALDMPDAARQAQLVCATARRAALELAPALRVNIIAPPSAVAPRWAEYTSAPGRQSPGEDDLMTALDYLIGAEPVTGETLFLDLSPPQPN